MSTRLRQPTGLRPRSTSRFQKTSLRCDDLAVVTDRLKP